MWALTADRRCLRDAPYDLREVARERCCVSQGAVVDLQSGGLRHNGVELGKLDFSGSCGSLGAFSEIAA